MGTNKGEQNGDTVSAWGEGLLKDLDVPEAMRRDIHTVLHDDEQIVWATRPCMDVVLAYALLSKIVGAVLIVASLATILLLASVIIRVQCAWWAIAGMACGMLIMLFVNVLGVALFMEPGRQRKNAQTRPCYLVAGRRLIIHPGMGFDAPKWLLAISDYLMPPDRSKDAIGPTAYSHADLTKMNRLEHKKFPGAGDIVLGMDKVEQSTLFRLVGIADVRHAERIIREKVLHVEVGQNLRAETRIQNIRPPFVNNLDQAAAELRAKVEPELTEGEEILWADRPLPRTSRGLGTGIMDFLWGFVGAITILGRGERKEPRYTLYAITNRRAMLWASRDTGVNGAGEKTFTTNMARRGPLSYYPTDLKTVSVEEDEGGKGAGSIIFKVVIAATKYKKGELTVRKKEDRHCFGILHIRNVQPVARLLEDKLDARSASIP